jgi:DnaJ family protein B protein 6
MSDHYHVLNISRTATVDEIKKAYRKLAIVWHPDKNPDNKTEATEKFRAIAEAYEILSDPEQRRVYDRGGVSCNNFERNSNSVPRGNFNRDFSNRRANDIFNAFFAEFDDFHQQAFSGFGGFGNNSFGADPFGRERRDANGHRTQRGDNAFGSHQSLFDDHNFFGGGDPFARMGGGFGGMHMNMHNMMLGGGNGLSGFGGGGMGLVSSSSSSFSSSTGINGAGRSVSTSTFIGPDGRKVTRKETTIIHPGGRRETSVEESVDDPPPGGSSFRGGQNRLANGSSHSQAIDLTTPKSTSRSSGNVNRSHMSSNGAGGLNYGGGMRK